MSKEREIARKNEEAYWEALLRYQEMLNYYGILPNVQEIAMNKILSLPPQQAIEEINRYWEDYLKDKGEKPYDNHNENNSPPLQSLNDSIPPTNQRLHQQNLEGLSPAQRKLYKHRQQVIRSIYETNRGRKK